MNNEDINVKYEDLTTGTMTIDKLKTNVETYKGKFISYQESISGEDVFAGPLAESAKEGFTGVLAKIDLTTENFTTISSYLTQARSNYEGADSNAKALYLSIKEDGKLAITEGLSGGVYVNPNAEKYQVDFVNQILPYALNLYNEKGILPSLTIAQACKESAFGTAKPGSGYNVFGIKASGWSGKTANARTGEQTASGSTYYINADFRDYDTLEAAVHDYGEVLSLERYDAVRNAKDYKEAAHAVKAGGYATGVNYDNSLITDYIEAYNLNQWDPVK